MKQIFIIAIALLALCGCNDSLEMENVKGSLDLDMIQPTDDNSFYYYYQGEKQMLSVNTSYAYVCRVISADEEEVDALITIDNKSEHVGGEVSTKKIIEYEQRYYGYEKKEVSTKQGILSIKEYRELLTSGKFAPVGLMSPSFKSAEGDEFHVAPEFYVKLKDDKDLDILTKLASEYGAKVAGKNLVPQWYTVYCTEQSKMNSLDMSNAFYETGLFAATTPGFVGCMKPTTTDPLYSYQWGIENTGQYGGSSTVGIDIEGEKAIKIATGSNIKVGVIDTGIDYSHPDINNTAYSYNSYTGVEYSSSATIYNQSKAHGTCCAGIIAAISNNSEGVSGIAPQSNVVAISNYMDTNHTTAIQLANSFTWAKNKGLSVISCSWYWLTPTDVLTNAINDAATNGRGGRGCIIVFASGNNNLSSVSYPSYLDNVICVGAIDPYGLRMSPSSLTGEPWGSNYGSALDVTAPGVLIATTDISGTKGCNAGSSSFEIPNNFFSSDFSDNNYTRRFDGTSSATPFVSGIAASILSRKPTLTRDAVTEIIEKTCTKLSSYTFNTSSMHPNGTWNQEVGHGLVNAFDAVFKAYAYPNEHEISGSSIVTTSGTNYIVNYLPTATSAQWRVEPSENFTIQRTGYNTARVISSTPGLTATLYADIKLSGGSVFTTLSKVITTE